MLLATTIKAARRYWPEIGYPNKSYGGQGGGGVRTLRKKQILDV